MCFLVSSVSEVAGGPLLGGGSSSWFFQPHPSLSCFSFSFPALPFQKYPPWCPAPSIFIGIRKFFDIANLYGQRLLCTIRLAVRSFARLLHKIKMYFQKYDRSIYLVVMAVRVHIQTQVFCSFIANRWRLGCCIYLKKKEESCTLRDTMSNKTWDLWWHTMTKTTQCYIELAQPCVVFVTRRFKT